MSTEQNKATVRRFFDLFNQGDLEAMGEVYAPNVVDHNPAPGQAAGLEGVKQILGVFRTGLPDITITVDAVMAEGDLVVSRQTGRGTQTGVFLGLPPTGKPVLLAALDMYRLAGGKIVEVWHIEDLLGLLQQLGAIPAPEPSAR